MGRSYLEIAKNEIIARTTKLVESTFKKGDDISISLIQRRCAVGYASASIVFNNMLKAEIIKPTALKLGIFKYEPTEKP